MDRRRVRGDDGGVKKGENAMHATRFSLRRSVFAGLLAACALALPLVAPAQPAAAEAREFEFGQDYFAAGEQLDVTRPAPGDVLAAGNRVTVHSDVHGDVLAAAGELRLAGPVQQDVLAAGREVVVTGMIAGNARAAGATLRLLREGRIGRNATLAGSELELQGAVDGYLLAVGRRIYLNGTVGGDAQLVGDDIELGPDARITGSLRYRSRNELKRAPSAVVGGTVEHLPWTGPEKKSAHRFPFAGRLIWSAGLGVLAALLLATVPAFAQGTSTTLRTRFGWSLLTGFIVLVCMPVAAIIALITVVGIPAGLVALLAYPVLLLFGYLYAGMALGDFALARFRPARAQLLGGRIAAAVLALLALAVLTRIPVVGGLIGLLAMLAGVGALLLQLRQGWKARALPV
jgi:cytoskeletal protein CcmA (bactofilin family)